MSAFEAGGMPLNIAGVEAMVYRAPVATPVQTSFGLMHDRPSCLVCITDEDGVQGWGEVWCNFPSVGAEHRARLLIDCVAPLLLTRPWDSPAQAFDALSQQLQILAVQSGEPGPIAQVIAGLDIAMWDLAARRARLPLWRLLGGRSPEVAVYASGLNPSKPEVLAARRAEEGHRAFKLKVGFGEERDLANLRALRQTLGEEVSLMVDANQAWSVDEAARMSQRIADFRPLWIEEPIAADLDPVHWVALAGRSTVPLAAGENFRGDAQFDAFLASGALRVVQPDLAKWGGFSRCIGLGQRILERGLWFCPHWLGGGIGLAASLHLKAAVGGEGMVEIDANPNPLRDLFVSPLARVSAGITTLAESPGLGIEPDLAAAAPFLVWQCATGSARPAPI